MDNLPSALYRPELVRELDRVAIEEYRIPGYTLMCRAGSAVFRLVSGRWPQARRLTVLCGGGNNGGDGYVVARLANEAGLAAHVGWLSDPAALKGDAAIAWRDAKSAGVPIAPFQNSLLEGADVVVDALLGTGLERSVEGRWAEAIRAVNQSRAPVLAVDIPSGLSARTGAVLGEAIRADATVTFIALKQGLFTGRAADICGDIRFASLSVPEPVFEAVVPSAVLYRGEDLPALLMRRPRDAHKGQFGHALVVGGNFGMAGAARMAGEAAARVGAGLVSVATRPEHAPVQAAIRPEIMFHGVDAKQALEPLIERASVVALGPGLGHDRWARALFECSVAHARPMVVDADALSLLAEAPFERQDWVLTPHPGEAARLLGRSVAEIQSDRFDAVTEIQRRFGGVALLKGAGTLVHGPDGVPSVCTGGNPGMASGGMGDVLTGVIAGLLAQGFRHLDSARAGAQVHAAAADRAAREGERGLLATDLLVHLRQLVNGE